MSDDADKAEILAALSARGLAVSASERNLVRFANRNWWEVQADTGSPGFYMRVVIGPDRGPRGRFEVFVTVLNGVRHTNPHTTAAAALDAGLRLAAREARDARNRLDAIDLAIAAATKKAKAHV